MAYYDIRISELPPGSFTGGAIMPADKTVGGVTITDGATGSQAGDAINKQFQYTQELDTTDKTIVGAINELQPSYGRIFTLNIQQGDTAATITDASITTNSVIDYYGIEPLTITTTAGQIVFTIEAAPADYTAKVVVY